MGDVIAKEDLKDGMKVRTSKGAVGFVTGHYLANDGRLIVQVSPRGNEIAMNVPVEELTSEKT